MKPLFSSFLIGKARPISPYLFLVLAFIIFITVFYHEDFSCFVIKVNPYSCNLDPLNSNITNSTRNQII